MSASGRPLRIVFFMGHPGFGRNFENLLAELARRGHEVLVAYETREVAAGAGLLPAGVETTLAPAAGASARLGQALRLGLDCLRFLEPGAAASAALRRRAARLAPPGVAAAARVAPVRRALRRVLAWERALPADRASRRFLLGAGAELVLVTPLVSFGSPQTRHLRAARRLGLPAAVCVASWDNLTTKGLLRAEPELVLVWNERQRREAVELHGVADERVVVTGAHSYDHWFERTPGGRDELCRAAGLDPARPYLLYACSSPFVAPDEHAFVADWLERLRAEGGPLADVQVLVRPHPLDGSDWSAVERAGARVRRGDYFDSLHHAAAVVGVQTSAMVEAAIAGRPVVAAPAPGYRDTREATPQFAHLAAGDAPLVAAGEDFAAHARRLEAALAGERPQLDAFLTAFARPHGLGAPAAPLAAAALEALASARAPQPESPPVPAQPRAEALQP